MSKQSETYTIDHPNIGNVMYRKDNLTNQYENFAYDNLDRLTGISYNGGASQAITYAANGNITSKYGSGSFLYGAKPHAVASVTIYPGAVSQDYQDVTYTPFNKVSNIAQRTPATRKLYTYDITYGPDEQRVKTVYTDTLNAITTRYYAGSYEKEIKGSVTRQIHYITGATGLVAVYIKKSNGQENMYYVCTDRQGSITALLNPDGTVAERYSYDAWGRRRNPANWNDYNVPAPTLINRGYTGHEMLDAFGLINMNGRMYDPIIGRILSPDKFVQSPTNTQSYNRYTYCFNNPLKYTDPSGWFEVPIYSFEFQDLSERGSGGGYNFFGGTALGGGLDFQNSGTVAGILGYTYTKEGRYMDNATGRYVDYSTVYDNYVVPRSTTFYPNEFKKTVGSDGFSLPIVSSMESNSSFSPNASGDWLTMVFWGTNSYSVAINIHSGVIQTYGGVNKIVNSSLTVGSVNFGNYKISSNALKESLNDFAKQTGYLITVVGGDRNAARNAAVGGSKGSRHIIGDAADIVVRGTSNRNVSIQAHNSGLFNTTIYYPNYSTPGALAPHVHVDLNPGHDNLLLIYKFVNGANNYLPWNP